MNDPDLRRNPVEILAEKFLERYRRGERPTVTEYLGEHPELSEEIREVFPALLAIEQAGADSEDPASPRHPLGSHDGFLPERLGDFRIKGEIGRGGMGVVYEAVQESLGRLVALKVLPLGALAAPAALKRFRREARSVAALHHSNIVPVFGIGEHAGYHYYAMQLIHGQTLEAVLGGVRRLRDVAGPVPTLDLTAAHRAATEIAGALVAGRFTRSTADHAGKLEESETTDHAAAIGPIVVPEGAAGNPSSADFTNVMIGERGESQYHRRIAGIGLQVAEALAYAHDQGVLHRDIKPSNLLMDEEGTVWVLDFGLARAEAAGEQSASRDVVGTLRYMAPERFDGRSDRRSDVYGLGVTLYELLTLRPACDATHQAALVHQVLHGTPRSPRQIDRRIPRDLETIVLKAMAKQPSARYATAHSLAEDVRRFLENRTILARRSTSLERTGRWCRRNPVVAALLTSIAALLTFLAGYYSVSATRYRHQFERARIAELDGRERLFSSYVAQARTSRFSRRPGQRFAALRALSEATKIRPTPELRDEAIACLALPDLHEVHRSPQRFHGMLLTFDSSLERYARLDWDGVVSVRRSDDDGEIRRFPPPVPGPFGESIILAFSPDGRHLAVTYAVGTGHLLRVWGLDRDLPALALEGPTSMHPQFTPDGRHIAVGHVEGQVVFHGLASGHADATWEVGPGIRDFAFSPDGRKLAVSLTGEPSKIQIREVPSSKIVREITLHAVCTLAWGLEGTTIAAASEHSRIYVYDAESGRQTGVLADHTSMGLFTAFQPAGSLLASNGWDAKLRIWRPQTAELLLTLPAAGPLSFRRDGLRFATRTAVGHLVVFQVADGREYRSLVQTPVRRHDFVTCSSLHHSGRLLAVGMTNGVGFWDIDRDVSVGWLPIGLTESLLFEPSGHLLTAGRTGLARWPVREGTGGSNSIQVGLPDFMSTPASGSLARSRDGRFLGLCQTGLGPIVVDRDHPKSPLRPGPQADVRYIAISPDGRWVATGSHNTREGVKVWSLPDGRFVRQFPNEGMQARPLFSPDGRWLATNLGHEVRLRTVGEWRDGCRLEGLALAFSSDGRLLALAVPTGSVQLVEAETGRLVASLDDPQQSRSRHAKFATDGSRLILASEDGRAAHVWDLRVIRHELAAMSLDWDWPALPEPDAAMTVTGPLKVTSDFGGQDFSWGASHPQELDRLNEALEIDPGDLYAIIRRGQVFLTKQRYDNSIADYTRALAIRPGDAKFLGKRGEAYLAKKEFARGIAECEASLATLPGQAPVQNALAWAYATAPPPFRDPAKALSHARFAVRLSPAIGSFRNTLGVALYRAGQYREAITELETSLAAASRDGAPFDLFVLAMCHARLGNTDRAKADFERARGLQTEARLFAEGAKELEAFHREARAILTEPKPR